MQRFFLSVCFPSIRDIFFLDESATILPFWKMQEKICLKCIGNTDHIMKSEKNLYEYSNFFLHHTSGICTTGSEYLRYGLSHHWIKSTIPHRALKNEGTHSSSPLQSAVRCGYYFCSYGFCGGSWQDVSCSKTLVIPRVSDCVALTLTTPEQYAPNLQEPGHMYLFGNWENGNCFAMRNRFPLL